MRYNEDVRLAYELNNSIMRIQPENEKLPVVITGRYRVSSQFQNNFIKGGYIGYSFFEMVENRYKSTATHTLIILAFMKILGINFDIPNENQMKRAIKEAASMPPYPNPGYVKCMQNYIVVRLSENMYEDE